MNGGAPEDQKLHEELRRNVHDNGPSLEALISREEARLNIRLKPVDPDLLPVAPEPEPEGDN
jgi:hypothetical protein